MPKTLLTKEHGMPSAEELIRTSAANFVGVVAPLSFQYGAHIKRLLLMFDLLALDMGESTASLVERRILSNAQKDIEWLSRSHLLTTLDGLAASSAPVRRAEVPVYGMTFLAAGLGREAALMRRAGGVVRVAAGGLRNTAVDLRTRFGIDAVAVPTGIEAQNADAVATREAVVRITLGEFPLPSDATPWEAVQSFRHDENARAQFTRLKQWINKTGKAGLTEYEVSDDLRAMISDYEESMRLHRMKASRGILEVLVTTTAEIAENLLRLKVSVAAKALFAVKEHKLTLLEEEKKTLGREIAYVVAAKKAFG